MAVEFDPRIVQIGIEIAGETVYFSGLDITAQGTRFGSEVNSECQIRIDNLTKEHRDYILTRTNKFSSLYLNPPIHITVKAGRKSYATTLPVIYYGMVTKSGLTQPPDIGIILQCITSYDQALNTVSYSSGPEITLKSLAQKAADDLGVDLVFQATDKKINNFTHSGPALNYIGELSEVANVNVTIDNKSLIIIDEGVPILGPIKEISQATGMIGIPEFIDSGVRVKYLLDNNTSLFQTVNIKSILNPSIDGTYRLYKLGFDIATRQTPFYWIAELYPLLDIEPTAAGGVLA